jgi:hypothetical protein
MPATQPGTRALSSTLALCLALIGAAAMLYYHQGLFMPRVVAVRTAAGLGNGYSFGNDFYQVWLSARELLLQKRDPYSQEMTLEIQTGLYGRPLDPKRPADPVDRRVFPYPVYADLLFWPTAEVPFPAVRIAVLFLLIFLTVSGVVLWIKAFEWALDWKWFAMILLLTLTCYPTLEGLFAEQLGLLVAFFLAASLYLIQRQRFFFAGILMALSTIKPQVAALAILYLLLWSLHRWQARRGFVVGFFLTLGLLLSTSLLVMPHWIRSWIHTILAYRHYTRPPLVTEVLTSPLGPTLSGPATLVLTAASILIAAWLVWKNRAAASTSFQFWLTLSLLFSITAITILPGQAVYDHLILIPGIFLLARHHREFRDAGPVPRILLSLGALLLFWNWIAAFALIALRPLLAPAIFDSTAVFSLPIRSAAPLPFAILALLAWTRRLTPSPNPASV